jgi:hypothetical protein
MSPEWESLLYHVDAGRNRSDEERRAGRRLRAALLEGVILTGWRTAARVHVEFQTTTNCVGAPDARTCFEGTIRIERAPEK